MPTASRSRATMSTVVDELHEIYDSAYQRAYQLSFEAAAQRGIAAIGDRHVYAHRMALFAANSAYRSAQARANREELTAPAPAPAPEELVAGAGADHINRGTQS